MLPYLVAIGLIAILGVLVNIALNVSEIRRLLRPRLTLPIGNHGILHDHSCGVARVAAFSVWKYRQNQWLLVQECGQEGCDCGPAPNRPGRFQGEVVRKECPAPSTPH